MGWEKDGATKTVTFFCEGVERGSECLRNSVYTVVSIPPNASVFAACWQQAEAAGWRSFKKRGRDWEYFCKECAADAETAYHEHNRQEQERERIKARNAY